MIVAREEIKDAVIRLLTCLNDPVDGLVLGPQIVREIVYRLLCDEYGGALRLLAIRHGRFSQMAKVLNRIHTEFDSRLNIEKLSEEAVRIRDFFGESFFREAVS